MAALEELKKKNPVSMTMLEFVVTQAEYSEVRGNAELAAEELAALRIVVEAASDVNKWLKKNGMGGTGHQRILEFALEELEAMK